MALGQEAPGCQGTHGSMGGMAVLLDHPRVAWIGAWSLNGMAVRMACSGAWSLDGMVALLDHIGMA